MKIVPQYAFNKCENLKTVVLGTNVEEIGYGAFGECTNLSDINLNDNITSFGAFAFSKCTSLTKVVLGKRLLKMDGEVFSECVNINDVEIHDGAATIGTAAFKKCTKLQTVSIPNSVQTIGNSAFQECSSLTTAKVGNGVEAISQYMLSKCNRLQTISLGSGVLSIGYGAFNDSPQIKSLTVLNPQPPTIGSSAFANKDAKLYVPAQSVSLYASADGWKDFNKIQSIGEQVYLTIRQSEPCAIRQAVNIGETYRFDILPETGWIIHSVTFNGEDVTGQLVDGTYTTPAITTSSTLVVVLEDEEDGIEQLQSNRIKVYATGDGDIFITNLNVGDAVSVYDTGGKMVRQQIADKDLMRVKMDSHGVYIVKAGTRTMKLSL